MSHPTANCTDSCKFANFGWLPGSLGSLSVKINELKMLFFIHRSHKWAAIVYSLCVLCLAFLRLTFSVYGLAFRVFQG